MLRTTIIVCGLLLGLLVAAIGLASDHNLWAGFAHVWADPWGRATLIDLISGLIFVAAWIAVVEPRPWCAAGWIVALFLLGNVITLIFLLWRTRRAQRFSDLFLPYRRGESPGP